MSVSLSPACAGGYFLDEFLCGQLGVTRALGNFTSDSIAVKQPADRLKFRTSSDGQPLQFGGPLIAGMFDKTTVAGCSPALYRFGQMINL